MNTSNQWQLSGNAAERYERVLVPVIFAPWAADLVALAKLRPGERVLDVACGTGVVARHAAERVGPEGHVTGLDLNEGMLEVARSQPIPVGAAAVAWVQSSALAMRVPDSSFDVVLCQQGIQFFPDRPQALREMIRVLVPSGRMFASVWEGTTPYTTAMWNAVERHVGADAATTLRKSRAIEDPKALQDLMMQAGFRDVEIVCRTRTARLPAWPTSSCGISRRPQWHIWSRRSATVRGRLCQRTQPRRYDRVLTGMALPFQKPLTC